MAAVIHYDSFAFNEPPPSIIDECEAWWSEHGNIVNHQSENTLLTLWSKINDFAVKLSRFYPKDGIQERKDLYTEEYDFFKKNGIILTTFSSALNAITTGAEELTLDQQQRITPLINQVSLANHLYQKRLDFAQKSLEMLTITTCLVQDPAIHRIELPPQSDTGEMYKWWKHNSMAFRRQEAVTIPNLALQAETLLNLINQNEEIATDNMKESYSALKSRYVTLVATALKVDKFLISLLMMHKYITDIGETLPSKIADLITIVTSFKEKYDQSLGNLTNLYNKLPNLVR